MRNVKAFLSQLTHHPGVYQMLGEAGIILYVGKAKNLKKRLSSYFQKTIQDAKTRSLIEHVIDIHVIVTRSEKEAVLLECNLIKKHKPRYNVLLRDDKSYPYITLSHHDHPRIDVYRGKRNKSADFYGPYPSSMAVREALLLVQKLFLLRTCRDSYFDARSRPCLLHQIGRCSAPCVNLISQEEYTSDVALAALFLSGKNDTVLTLLQNKMQEASDKQQYELAAHARDQIARIRQLHDKQYVNVKHGEADVVGFAETSGIPCIQLLCFRQGELQGSQSYFPKVPPHANQNDIISAFLSQHYFNDESHQDSIPRLIILPDAVTDQAVLQDVLSEMAQHMVTIHVPKRGEKRKWLDMAMMNASQSLSSYYFKRASYKERLHMLAQVLTLDAEVTRIECFDISHTMGEATVGSCVVFNTEGPLKSDYRQYHVEGIVSGDDAAAMAQVLTRRFKSVTAQSVLPDLLIVDGGKTQLSIAQKVLSELSITSIHLLGVSKGPGRKPGFESLHRINKPVMHLPPDSEALHLIQHIRDEAHRFAITKHRQLRQNKRQRSPLERISGVGAKRRRELLRYFGGIQGVAHASLDELTKVPGINRSLAERIFSAFHDASNKSTL